jgi:hypothetical protein
MLLTHKICKLFIYVWTLEKTEGAFKNGQSRETGNIGHQTQNENKPKQSRETGTIGRHTSGSDELIKYKCDNHYIYLIKMKNKE